MNKANPKNQLTPKNVDKWFLSSLIDFNLKLKQDTAKILYNYCLNNQTIECIKQTQINLIEIYVSLSETALMILYSLKEKKSNKKSFTENYTKIFVSEKNKGEYNSEKLLEEIDKLTLNEFLDKFGIIKLTDVLNSLDKKARQNLSNNFGKSSDIRKQFRNEISNLKKSLTYVIHNRIKTKDGNPFPLYKAYNKIKHGMQYLSESENIAFLLNYTDEMKKENNKYFIFECNMHEIEIYYSQIDLMAFALKHLLRYFI